LGNLVAQSFGRDRHLEPAALSRAAGFSLTSADEKKRSGRCGSGERDDDRCFEGSDARFAAVLVRPAAALFLEKLLPVLHTLFVKMGAI